MVLVIVFLNNKYRHGEKLYGFWLPGDYPHEAYTKLISSWNEESKQSWIAVNRNFQYLLPGTWSQNLIEKFFGQAKDCVTNCSLCDIEVNTSGL